MRLLITICAAALLTVGLAPAAAATPSAPVRVCDTVKVPLVATVDGRALWKYRHSVAYCAEDGKIVDVVGPKVTVEIFDPTCTFDGLEEQEAGPLGGETVETFSMGLMTCDPPDAEPYQVNPWVILTVSAGGHHTSTMGIEPR
jgi:hypothetical protein